MKGQLHNQGELKELNVKIEATIVDAFQNMVETTGYPLDELVVIALKRFRASHSDYERKTLKLD